MFEQSRQVLEMTQEELGEKLSVSRRTAPGLLAAFARAKEIGLSVEVIERALRSRLRPAEAAAAAVEPPAPKRKGPRG